MVSDQKVLNCMSNPILGVLGKKWNLHIIRLLEMREIMRFNQITKEIKITPKMLDLRLTELTSLGIVNLERFNETPPRVEYSLTEKGLELVKCFALLDKWTEKYG